MPCFPKLLQLGFCHQKFVFMARFITLTALGKNIETCLCWPPELPLNFFITETGLQLTDNRGRTGFLFFFSVVVTSYLTAGHSHCSDHFLKNFPTGILPELLPVLRDCGLLSVT